MEVIAKRSSVNITARLSELPKKNLYYTIWILRDYIIARHAKRRLDVSEFVSDNSFKR